MTNAFYLSKVKHLFLALLLFPTVLIGGELQEPKFNQIDLDHLGQLYYTCATEDDLGRIWFGTRNGHIIIHDGYSFFNLRSFLPDSVAPGFGLAQINELKMSSNGRMWVCTNNGVHRINTTSFEIKAIEKTVFDTTIFKNTYLSRTIETTQNGHHWIGGYNGILHIDQELNLAARYLFSNDRTNQYYDENHIFKIVQDARNEQVLWLATEYGLRKFDIASQKSQLIRHPTKWHDKFPEVAQYEIWDLIQDSTGRLWMAAMYSGGILSYDSQANSWTEYRYCESRRHQPNFGNSIRSICTFSDSAIFVAGNFGVGKLNPEHSCLSYIDTLAVKNIGIVNALFLDRHRQLWILTENGLLKGKLSAEWPINNYQLAAYINDDKVNIRRPVQLPSLYDNLKMEFTVLGAPPGESWEYEYRLRQGPWRALGSSRIINLGGLSPGHHTISARAHHTRYGTIDTERSITIEYPFYLKSTFLFLCGIGFVVLIWLAYRFMKYFANKEAQIKLKYEQELAKVKMNALRSQMNPHFIFNSLNSIYNFVLHNQADLAGTYLSKFSKLVRKVLLHSNENHISLNEELEIITLYLELERLRLQDTFDYNISIDNAISTSDVQIPPMLIQPILENAIWHGLRTKKSHGFISVVISAHNEFMKISVEDNGVGRTASKQSKTTKPSSKKSMGLTITQQRIDFINLGNDLKGSVDIIDLMDDKGIPSGTRVNLNLPLKHISEA